MRFPCGKSMSYDAKTRDQAIEALRELNSYKRYFFLAIPITLSDPDITPLQYAVDNGRIDVAQVYLEHFDTPSGTTAAYRGHLESIIFLHTNKIDVQYCLPIACGENNVAMVEYLLSVGYKPCPMCKIKGEQHEMIMKFAI